MKPEITDTAYITALTFELVTRHNFLTLGAPTLPSLRREVIYKPEMNVRGVPVFLQYKLGDHIVGTGSSLKDLWGIPYYRFPVHPGKKTKRHDQLMGLEGVGKQVYYVVPEFHTTGGLYESLMGQTVLDNSVFWSPAGIGSLTEKARNFIAYKRNAHYGILEPGRIRVERVHKGRALLNALADHAAPPQGDHYDDEKLIVLGDQMVENHLKFFHSTKDRRLARDIGKSRGRIDARDYLCLISTLLYDCHVYMAVQQHFER
jgi:hypothetical protein